MSIGHSHDNGKGNVNHARDRYPAFTFPKQTDQHVCVQVMDMESGDLISVQCPCDPPHKYCDRMAGGVLVSTSMGGGNVYACVWWSLYPPVTFMLFATFVRLKECMNIECSVTF